MYHLQILTPETIFFDAKVTSLVAPGAAGYLGILTNHAPLMALLKEGTLIIIDENNIQSFYRISGGFLHVKKNEVTILIDQITLTAPVNWLSGV